MRAVRMERHCQAQHRSTTLRRPAAGKHAPHTTTWQELPDSQGHWVPVHRRQDNAWTPISICVHNRVPFLCNGADADAFYASVAKELGPRMIEKLTPEFLRSLTDEFLLSLFDEFASQAQFKDLEPLACAYYCRQCDVQS